MGITRVWVRLGHWVGGSGSGVWNDIVRVGEEIDGMGLEFTTSCIGELGDGRDIRFWVDRWVDNQRLCDRFPRLYHLDRRKEGCVGDKGSWVNDVWDKWRWMLGEDGEKTWELGRDNNGDGCLLRENGRGEFYGFILIEEALTLNLPVHFVLVGNNIAGMEQNVCAPLLDHL
ncbi:hypothetical protein Tco_0102897 [Tanacetum coccineum]